MAGGQCAEFISLYHFLIPYPKDYIYTFKHLVNIKRKSIIFTPIKFFLLKPTFYLYGFVVG